MKVSKALEVIAGWIGSRKVTRRSVEILSPRLLAQLDLQGKHIRSLKGREWQAALHQRLFGQNACRTCGSTEVMFTTLNSGFKHHCSSRCAGADSRTEKRRKKTCRAVYGVDYVQQDNRIRKRFIKTMQERHGVSYTGQSADLRAPSPFNQKEVQDKAKVTMMAKYGVEHCLQNREIHERQQKSGFTIRRLKIKGKTFRVRGYEPEAIRYLARNLKVPVENILTSASEGLPSIPWYDKEGRKCVYHPDIYAKIRGRWTLIEVKSTWTAGLRNDKRGVYYRNRRKARAAVGEGYPFLLVVVGRDKSIHVIKNCHLKKRKQVLAELGPLHSL